MDSARTLMCTYRDNVQTHSGRRTHRVQTHTESLKMRHIKEEDLCIITTSFLMDSSVFDFCDRCSSLMCPGSSEMLLFCLGVSLRVRSRILRYCLKNCSFTWTKSGQCVYQEWWWLKTRGKRYFSCLGPTILRAGLAAGLCGNKGITVLGVEPAEFDLASPDECCWSLSFSERPKLSLRCWSNIL